MSLTQKTIQAQSRRLLMLPYPPSTEDRNGWVIEFDRIARKFCESDEHLVSVVDKLMESQYGIPPASRCPAAGDIVAVCEAERPPTKGPQGCLSCSDGYAQITKYADGVPIDVAAYCTCERGQWLKDRQQAMRAA